MRPVPAVVTAWVLTLALTGCPKAPDAVRGEPPVDEPATETKASPPLVGVDPATGAPMPELPPPSAEPVSNEPDGSHPELVGVAVPLSGKYKAWGEAILEGVAIALEGSSHKVVAKDTRGEADGAAEAMSALAAEGVVAALGGVTNAEALRAAEAAQAAGLPFLSLARVGGVPEAGPFVFRNMLTGEAQARALVELAMARKGLRRFAILWPTNAYGTELAHTFWDAVEAKGGEIRGAEPYEPDRTTFGPLVKGMTGKLLLDERQDWTAAVKEIQEKEKDPYRRRRAIEKLRENLPPVVDFDAIFLPDFAKNVALVAPAIAVEDVFTATCDPRELERVRKATGREDVRAVQLLGANGWDDPSLVAKAGRYVQCAIFVDGFFAGSERPATKRFVEAFQGRHGRPPSILEASAHDAAAIVRQVVAQGAASREAVRGGVAGLRGFEGATGDLGFDDRREVQKPLFFLTVEGDAIRELRPEELRPPGAG